MAVQKQDDQHEHIFSNYVRIQDVVQKTCLKRWTIGNIVSLSNMIEGSYCSWDLYTAGQLVDGLQQKKENRFSLNGNGIMSSFLGR